MSQVVVILGSKSDEKILEDSAMLGTLSDVGVSWELSIISAHRNPDELEGYCNKAMADGVLVFIGAAGMSAALPGAITASIRARRPVIGVPLPSDVLEGIDALLSMVRMPPGRPVAVPGIGKSGLRNAAILACQIVAMSDPDIHTALCKFIHDTNKPAQIGIQFSEEREG